VRRKTSLFGPGRYQIRVGCEVDDRWAEWFEGLVLTRSVDGETTFCGMIRDQAALHGLLARIRDLGWPLVAVNRVSEPASRAAATADACEQNLCLGSTVEPEEVH
jgi:hypothetical protein